MDRILKAHFDSFRDKGLLPPELEKYTKQIIEEKPGLNASAYMGLVMAKYRGKVDGKKVMEILKKNL